MRNYSFTLTNPSGLDQLYRMGQFPDLEHAICLAELIASELTIDDNGEWPSSRLEVRDCEGLLVFSVLIGQDAVDMTNGGSVGGPTRSQPCA